MLEGDTASSSSPTEIENLIKKVYRETWYDFYAWEQDHCLRTLHSLARSLPEGTSELPNTTIPPDNNLPVQNSSAVEELIPTENEKFTVLDYSTTDEAPSSSNLSVEVIEIVPLFKPCAPYEICTPVNRNLEVGDDSEYMPFIPYMDDPKFNYQAHVADYRYFEWQLPNCDPDLEVIIIQTAYKLHVDHRLSFSIIDESGVLPLPLLSVPKGLIHTGCRRSFPNWKVISSRPFPLPYLPNHATVGPSINLSNLIHDFCSNFNCIIGYCTTHMGEMPVPPAVPPTIPSSALAHTVEAPCGTECFLLGNPLSIASGTFWDNDDTETLYNVLRYAPDISPCDLAVICRKPCQEVFKHRQRSFPDTDISRQPEKAPRGRPIRNSSLRYKDHDAASFIPNRPCSHPGPCDLKSKCPCFLNDAHCESWCRCDRKCLRRWRGCTCAKSKLSRTCGTYRCPCYHAHRECDPDLCIKCDAKLYDSDATADICKNAALQRNERKLTEVRQSSWGLGLFLGEPVEENDLITEYTGELLYEPTVQCRDFVSQHSGRTYVFQLNPAVSIDSNKAGNESRFINHDPENPNCHARIRLVNGEHRIGLFALTQMDAGTEILLDYGDSFFKPPESDKAKVKSIIQDQVEYVLDQHSSDETYGE